MNNFIKINMLTKSVLPIPEMKQYETTFIISSISVNYDYQSHIQENKEPCLLLQHCYFLFIFL